MSAMAERTDLPPPPAWGAKCRARILTGDYTEANKEGGSLKTQHSLQI